MLERFINRLKRGASMNNSFMGGDGKDGARQLQLYFRPPSDEEEGHLRKVSPRTRQGQGPKKEQAEIIFSEAAFSDKILSGRDKIQKK